MRIGIFTDTYPPYINGVSTSIVMLENSLRKQGHQVFIVTVNQDNMSYKYEDNGRIIKIPGIPVGIYDYRLTGIYPLRVVKKIKKWNLDIIHSHTEFGVGTFARIIAKQLHIPLVHTYHTMYEDYVHYITKGHFDTASKKAVEYFTKFYCDTTATELIVPSKKTYDLFKQKYKFDKNIHIVPTGIDVERFYRKNLSSEKIKQIRNNYRITEHDFCILFVGRLAEEKNIEFLIEAHANIVKKHKFAKLIIVGGGPDYDKYIKKAKKLKLEDNIVFTNAVPWDLMPYYYALGDVFVTASRSETQGLTIIEAFASSLPVVCANDESFNQTVIDGLNGFVFDNKKEYINKITYLIENENDLKRMSSQAKITSVSHSLKYYAQNILDVYNEALGSKKKKAGIISRILKNNK